MVIYRPEPNSGKQGLITMTALQNRALQDRVLWGKGAVFFNLSFGKVFRRQDEEKKL